METIKADELRKEKEKLEGDRATLNERLQAINGERERIVQQITMIAGALQTLNHFIDKVDPEVDLEDEVQHIFIFILVENYRDSIYDILNRI